MAEQNAVDFATAVWQEDRMDNKDDAMSTRLPIDEAVHELKRRLEELMQDRGMTPDRLMGSLDRFFWFGCDIEAFANSNYSPATLTLTGLDRLCSVLGVPLGYFLKGLDGDARPLPDRLPDAMDAWHIGQHVGSVIRRRRTLLGKSPRDAAEVLQGAGPAYVENVEDGWVEQSVLDLIWLNEWLELTMADLVGDLADPELFLEGASAPTVNTQRRVPLGETREGDLVVRMWFRPHLAPSHTAWMLLVLRRLDGWLDVVGQDELTDEEWRVVCSLADRIVAQARASMPELADVPEFRFSHG